MTAVLALVSPAPIAAADPEDNQTTAQAGSTPDPNGADVDAPPADPPPPVDDGLVASAPPATTKTPDGSVLTVSARDETQLSVAPLTTASSTRNYVVGGTFDGLLTGPDQGAHGTLEVGYEIGCGIDMSSGSGVVISGSIGVTPGNGATNVATMPQPLSLGPSLYVPITGGVAVGLLPGFVKAVPVVNQEFIGTAPRVVVSTYTIKIDGCVGQSFIRSYATLTQKTDSSSAVLSYNGITKVV